MSNTVTPDLPVVAQWFAALAVPIAATVGLILGTMNYRLQSIKRNNDLFDKRIDLLIRYWAAHGYTLEETAKLNDGTLTKGDAVAFCNRVGSLVHNISIEAEFVFNREVADQIQESLDDLSSYHYQIMNSDLSESDKLGEEWEIPIASTGLEPFRKYLRLR